MRQLMVWLVLLGLSAAAGTVRAHPENMSAQGVYDLVREEVRRLQDEMTEAQITRFDLLLRVALIEQYMHWFVPEFTNEWERRFPEKVKNMKEAGVWPDDEALYGRRFNQLERVVLDEWVRLRDEDLAGCQ